VARHDDQRPVVRCGAFGQPAQLVAVDGVGEGQESSGLRVDGQGVVLRELDPLLLVGVRVPLRPWCEVVMCPRRTGR
jgi:hypothetical protein